MKVARLVPICLVVLPLGSMLEGVTVPPKLMNQMLGKTNVQMLNAYAQGTQISDSPVASNLNAFVDQILPFVQWLGEVSGFYGVPYLNTATQTEMSAAEEVPNKFSYAYNAASGISSFGAVPGIVQAAYKNMQQLRADLPHLISVSSVKTMGQAARLVGQLNLNTEAVGTPLSTVVRDMNNLVVAINLGQNVGNAQWYAAIEKMLAMVGITKKNVKSLLDALTAAQQVCNAIVGMRVEAPAVNATLVQDALSGNLMAGMELTNVNLSRVLTSRVAPKLTFENIDAQGSTLSGSDFAGQNFSGANLQGANFSGCNLRGIKAQNANLTDASFSGADLTAADLSGANLTTANLYGADLSATNLSGAQLGGADVRLVIVDDQTSTAGAQNIGMGVGAQGFMMGDSHADPEPGDPYGDAADHAYVQTYGPRIRQLFTWGGSGPVTASPPVKKQPKKVAKKTAAPVATGSASAQQPQQAVPAAGQRSSASTVPASASASASAGHVPMNESYSFVQTKYYPLTSGKQRVFKSQVTAS